MDCPWRFSRQEYWSGLPCPPPEDLPNPGIEPVSLTSPALAGSFFTTSTTWKAPLPASFSLLWKHLLPLQWGNLCVAHQACRPWLAVLCSSWTNHLCWILADSLFVLGQHNRDERGPGAQVGGFPQGCPGSWAAAHHALPPSCPRIQTFKLAPCLWLWQLGEEGEENQLERKASPLKETKTSVVDRGRCGAGKCLLLCVKTQFT